LNQHRLIVSRSVIESDAKGRDEEVIERRLAYQLFHQLTHLTVDRGCLAHDDRLDALAGAVQYWNESLAIDEDLAIRERQSELWDLELQAYMGNLEGALDRNLLGGSITDLAAAPATGGWMRVKR